MPLNCTTWVKGSGFPSTSFPQSFCDPLQVCKPLCSHTPFQLCLIPSIGLRSGLCDGHSKTVTLLSVSHFVSHLAYLGPYGTHLQPSCSVHQFLLQQNSPTTRCCHPRIHGWDVFSGFQASPVFLQTMVILTFQTTKHVSRILIFVFVNCKLALFMLLLVSFCIFTSFSQCLTLTR